MGTDINSWELLVRVHWAGIKSQFFCLKRECVVLPQAISFPPSYITLPCWETEKANYVLTQFSFVLHFTNRLWVHRCWRYKVDRIQCSNEKNQTFCLLIGAQSSHWKYILPACELNLLYPSHSWSFLPWKTPFKPALHLLNNMWCILLLYNVGHSFWMYKYC